MKSASKLFSGLLLTTKLEIMTSNTMGKYILLLPRAPPLSRVNAHSYKFTVVYCESVNLIGYIIVCYLLIVNSYVSVHIARHV